MAFTKHLRPNPETDTLFCLSKMENNYEYIANQDSRDRFAVSIYSKYSDLIYETLD